MNNKRNKFSNNNDKISALMLSKQVRKSLAPRIEKYQIYEKKLFNGSTSIDDLEILLPRLN